jgi:hypothetical protein
LAATLSNLNGLDQGVGNDCKGLNMAAQMAPAEQKHEHDNDQDDPDQAVTAAAVIAAPVAEKCTAASEKEKQDHDDDDQTHIGFSSAIADIKPKGAAEFRIRAAGATLIFAGASGLKRPPDVSSGLAAAREFKRGC